MSAPRCFPCDKRVPVPSLTVWRAATAAGAGGRQEDAHFCAACTARLYAAIDAHDRERAR